MNCNRCGNVYDASIGGCPNCNGQNMVSSPIKKEKDTSKSLIIIIVFLTIVLIGIIVYGVWFKPEKTLNTPVNNQQKVEGESGTRTIMVYIIGSDLESRGGAATSDITEMISSNYNEEDVNILLYTGGASYWHNNTIDEDENAIYEIKDGELNKLKTYDVVRMTNPKTLTEFLDYGYEKYQSDLYSLILWDHGGGPAGYGIDENDSTQTLMSIVDIDNALNNSKLVKDEKLEFIGFDACLMSSIEIANYLKEEAEYLIASSENEPGDGWDYSFLGEINRNTSTEELGKYIIDYYYDFYIDLGKQYQAYGYDYEPEITLSLINLSKISDVVNSLDDLFEEIDTPINVSTYSKITREASRTLMYGYSEGAYVQTDLIDLYSLVEELDDYNNEGLLSNIEDAILYHKSTIDECNGISIYFPITTKPYYSQIKKIYSYDKLVVSENYKNFLKSYVNIGTGDRLVKSNLDNITPDNQSDKLSIELPSDIANNYQSANYMIFRKIDDGSYLPIYLSRDVVLDGNKITANVANQRISVSDVDGSNPMDVIAIEHSRDASSVTYILSTVLQYWDEDNFLETFETDAVNIYLRVDNKTKIGKIIDIKEINDKEEIGLSSKVTYDLNDWTMMQFVSSSYFLYDDNGNKLDDWQKSGTMYGTEVKIADGYSFRSTELENDDEYYAMFRVQDTQGNVYETELVKIN